MSKPLKPKRGTTAQNDAYIGEAYEVTLDTEKHTLRVHDGVTAGGHELARGTDVQTAATAAQNAQNSADAAQSAADSALAVAEEAASKAGLPLGFEYVRLTGQTPPFGGVDYLGQETTRAMYADLWAWLQANKPDAIVSEDEWQALYAAQNGNVSKFSTGDGSTTFRFPRMVGYVKGVASAGEIGGYTKEGLPGITALFTSASYSDNTASGAMQIGGGSYGNAGVTGSALGSATYRLDASRCSSVYGNSDHVTPETVTVVMGVIAIGAVAEVGTATEAGLVAEVAEIGGNVGALTAGVANAEAIGAEGRAKIVGWGMPDYSGGVQLNANVDFIAPCDGVILWIATATSAASFTINGVVVLQKTSTNQFYSVSMPFIVKKGDIANFSHSNWGGTYFYPLKGTS